MKIESDPVLSLKARTQTEPPSPTEDGRRAKPWSYRPASDLGLSFFERNCSLDCERGSARRLVHAASSAFLRSYLRHAHGLQVLGRPNLPERGPFLIVSNHSSHFDALVLGASVPARRATDVSLLAAGDTFFCSKTRAALASIFLNARPVWRGACGSKALGTIRNRLLGGDDDRDEKPIMVLFPEGTRSRSGNLARFKAGVGALVAGTPIPVVPCGIVGAREAWPAGRMAPRRSPITLSIGPALTFEDQPNERRGWRLVAAELEARVRQLTESAQRCHDPGRATSGAASPSAAVRRLNAESMG